MKLLYRLEINMFGMDCNWTNSQTGASITYFGRKKMFVAENFIRSLEFKYVKHKVYTHGGTWGPQANFLNLKQRLHSPLDKSMIERVMQYLKDRTECFEDYYHCKE